MSEFKFCKNCGAPLVEGAKFCGNCGAPVPQDEPENETIKFCPNCGAPVGDGMVFCENCGARLIKDTGSESIENAQSDSLSAEGSKDSVYSEDEEVQYSNAERDMTSGTGKINNESPKKSQNFRPLILTIAAIALFVVVLWTFAFISRDTEDTTKLEEDEFTDNKVEDQEVKQEQEVEQEVEQSDEILEEVAQMSKEQIRQGALDLYNQLVEYSVSDPEKFADLCIGATEEQIQDAIELYSEYNIDNVAGQIAAVIGESGASFGMEICYYTYEDSDQNTTYDTLLDDFTMTYTESGWKKDYSTSTWVYGDIETGRVDYPPEVYVQALDAERNCEEFMGRYLYLDDTAVYDGEVYCQLAFLSQDENGGLDVFIWIGNGIDKDVKMKEFTIDITDDILGTVINTTVPCNEEVKAGHSKLADIHIDDSSKKVLTGTKEWTDLNESIIYEYEEE